MKKLVLAGIVLIFAAACKTGENSQNSSSKSISVKYPATRIDPNVKDNYHNTIVPDPYRWLEDDNSEETKAWVKAQNVVTFGYLDQIPYRKTLKDRLTKLWNFERYTPPSKEGGKYYYFKNNGLQNQSVMYVQDKLDGPAQPVLDPNTLSKEGTVALGATSFNKDGSLLAFAVAEAGSDWQRAQVIDLKTGKTLNDTVRWIKFSGLSWWKDGFFYSRYPEPKKGDELKGRSLNHKVYYHQIGTPQSKDELIHEDNAHPEYNFYGGTTDDERFFILSVAESTTGNQLWFKDLSKKGAKLTPIITNVDNDYTVIDNINQNLLVLTNRNAPNQRIVSVNTEHQEEASWKVVVPENEDVIQSAQVLGGRLVVSYLHNAYSRIKIFKLDGTLERELKLPAIGTVGAISGKRDDDKVFYSFTSFTYPTSIFELDLSNGLYTIFKAPTVDFDPTAYETNQVWYTSKDGTKVPMFITHKKGLAMDGNNPCLLYGYGGFNISQQPGFSVSRAVLLENGGVYAVANIRGGGEFGEKWHKSGTLGQKQNVFDDFIGAAEYLQQNKYTSKEKMAIEGGSNGGLLVGACMTQRPDLFKVCFPRVGVLDMLRYQQFTIGRAWSTDYGLSENPEDFKYLIKYSPVHNVRPLAYPATLVMTGDHDDRVVPAHSFKFIAELQAKQKGSNPVLVRIDTSAGHGAGKPTSKLIEESADVLSFFFYNIGKKDVKK